MKRKISRLYDSLNYEIMALIVKSEMENTDKKNLMYDIQKGTVSVYPGDEKQRPLHCRFLKNGKRVNIDFAKDLEKIVHSVISKKLAEIQKEE